MKHVLIVDDALDLGRLLKTTLNLLDPALPVVVVPSGEEALLEASRYPLDLLVTDVRLPGMSGFELVEKVRQRHPEAKIIIITGLTDEEVFQKVRAYGVEAFFTKPMSIPDFTEAARRCLGMTPISPVTAEQAETSEAEKTVEYGDLSDILTHLHQTLSAQTVALLDARGRVAARAGGSISDDFDSSLASSIQAALHAGSKVSRLLNNSIPKNVFLCQGEKSHLVLAPVGDYSLVIQLEAKKSNLRIALAFEEALEAQMELMRVLEQMGLWVISDVAAVPPLAEEIAPIQEPEAEIEPVVDFSEFEEIFTQKIGLPLAADSSNFWDEAPASVPIEPLDADVLTYEQARRLGLAPEE